MGISAGASCLPGGMLEGFNSVHGNGKNSPALSEVYSERLATTGASKPGSGLLQHTAKAKICPKKADSSLRKMLLPPPQGSVQADAYSS